MSASVENHKPMNEPSILRETDDKEKEPIVSPSLSNEYRPTSGEIKPSMARPEEEVKQEKSRTSSGSERSKHDTINKPVKKSTRRKERKSLPKKVPFRNVNSKCTSSQKAVKPTAPKAIRTASRSAMKPGEVDDRENNSHDEVQYTADDSVSAFLYTEDYEDTPAAILAAQMGQNTFGYMGALPVQGGQVSPERSQVIKDILKNFDLERVMSRYRGNTMYSTYRHSLKNAHFRSCLEEIMGRERAPFDDQRWNERLMKKVMADLERRLDENERELEEAENRRILKLKLMGIYNGDSWREEERKSHVDKPHKKTAAERKLEKRNKLARESLFRPSEDIETQMEILHRDVRQTKKHSSGNTSDTIATSNDNSDNTNSNSCNDAEVSAAATVVDGARDQRDFHSETEVSFK
ncbi:hypothetical protein ElyMa_000469700 [Elysia marginata]|uniref:TFIIS central domain-containing protein n=1 Tax=Elysia marginata TaxID=1093978 RepID=A0AAV4FRM0_9GAST|nr:hypothetical protein ElyMa_000469700 [Elysia marginata]